MLKNKFVCTILIVLLIMAVLTACSSSESPFITDEVNPQIDVYGVQIYMPEEEVHKLIPTEGEEAQCIYGYEYQYEESLVNIGFNSDTKEVRRVSTKNPDTSIYGVVPGMELEEAYTIIDSHGFTKSETSEDMFYKENIRMTLISMKGTLADGIIVEINPE
ncbi:hypothetical protein E9840_11435 [Tissierella creatinini]|nr:hypothetical protein E9840_11435 [Tissierella creatinini]TJX61957.1 hypothetical protein E8P77_17645 [Soehngenia saccharolytica]